jgi:hypothetical protein
LGRAERGTRRGGAWDRGSSRGKSAAGGWRMRVCFVKEGRRRGIVGGLVPGRPVVVSGSMIGWEGGGRLRGW